MNPERSLQQPPAGRRVDSEAARALQVIVRTERLVADLEEHTEMLARFIEEERQIRGGQS